MTLALPSPRRLPALLALVVAIAGAVALIGPGVASAAPKCAKLVVADWYGDGRVDRVYPLHCYNDAIRSLPIDVLDYSNAKEDILRALSFAKRGKPDPGDTGSSSGDAGSGGGSNGSGGGATGGSGGGSGGSGTPTAPGGTPIGEPGETVAAGEPVDTSGPSSVPVPLIVLGGLALLLLAAGGAGYLNRRAQARKSGGGPGDPAV